MKKLDNKELVDAIFCLTVNYLDYLETHNKNEFETAKNFSLDKVGILQHISLYFKNRVNDGLQENNGR